jgi:hypothetical protein
LNAVVFAIIICLLFYYAGYQSFSTLGVFGLGTTVYVGTCNALQWKVAYLFHQFDWIKVFLLVLSIFGGLAYFAIIAVSLWEYYYEAHQLYYTGFFWLYGFFAVPFFVIFLDVLVYQVYFFIAPTKEMLYREVTPLLTLLFGPLLVAIFISFNAASLLFLSGGASGRVFDRVVRRPRLPVDGQRRGRQHPPHGSPTANRRRRPARHVAGGCGASGGRRRDRWRPVPAHGRHGRKRPDRFLTINRRRRSRCRRTRRRPHRWYRWYRWGRG